MHIADVHWGACPDVGLPWGEAREHEIKESFLRLLEKAQQEQVDLILIAGDLFHGQPLLRELRELNYYFEKLLNIPIVLIAGNHDHIGSSSYYKEFEFAPNVTMLKEEYMQKVYFPQIETTVWGFSYHRRKIKERLYDECRPEGEGFHILMAHGGDAEHIPIDYEKLKWSGFDYIALGHIHKPAVLAEDLMAYPGSLEPLDSTETGLHGYIMGEIETDSQQIEFIPFSQRTYEDITVYLTSDKTNAHLMDEIRQEITRIGVKNIYRIHIKGNRMTDFKIDLYELTQEYHILEVADESEEEYDLKSLYEENKNNLLGEYIRYFEQGKGDPIEKKALHYGIQALLSTRERSK